MASRAGQPDNGGCRDGRLSRCCTRHPRDINPGPVLGRVRCFGATGPSCHQHRCFGGSHQHRCFGGTRHPRDINPGPVLRCWSGAWVRCAAGHAAGAARRDDRARPRAVTSRGAPAGAPAASGSDRRRSSRESNEPAASRGGARSAILGACERSWRSPRRPRPARARAATAAGCPAGAATPCRHPRPATARTTPRTAPATVASTPRHRICSSPR